MRDNAVEVCLKGDDQVIVSVRGKGRDRILDVEKYAQMREYALTVALDARRLDLWRGEGCRGDPIMR